MIKNGFLIAAGVLCFVVAAYLVYIMVRPSGEYSPKLPPERMRLAEKLVPKAVGDMRSKLPPTYFGAVLNQFKGHRNAHDLRKLVEDEIVDREILRLKTIDEVAEEKKENMGWLIKGHSFLQEWASSVGLTPPNAPDEEVKKALRSAEIHGFINGKVVFLEDSADEERLELTLHATDVAGKEIFRETYEETMRKSILNLEYYRIKVGEMGIGWKLLIWVTFALGLPVVTFFVPMKALKTDSNGLILSTLVGYTAVDGLVALALMGFAVSGFLSFLVLLAGLALAAVYNYGIFTEIKDFM